nr:Ig-like domain-containing protein [Streptomyces sp. HNM0574]
MALTLSTCGGSGGASGREGGGKERAGSAAGIAITPEDGAEDVAPSGGLKVAAEGGKLTRVRVSDADGEPVAGRLAADGRGWTPASHLATDTAYTVRAVARDADGRERTETSRFRTFAPENTFIGRFTPEDGSTVGAGMPVSLEFDHPVENRAEVEKAISVSADPEVRVEGHWFGDQRLDFRPEEYWRSGTKVELALGLDGVEASDGRYGTQHKTVGFTVGRQQVSVVDAKKKTMAVTRDGERIKTVPITSGSDEHPTYNGRMVISERHRETRMDGRTVGFGRDEDEGGYDIKDVPHAMRLSTSGTFIHGNYWNPRHTFGEANLSHGCVGLFDKKGGGDKGTPGAWFYANSMVGDVVEIKNSKDETIDPDNGLNGWNMSWEEWTEPQS